MCVAAPIAFEATFAIPRQGTVRTSTRLSSMRIIGSRLCLLVAGAALVAGPAFAQAPNPAAPLDSAPRETTPGAEPTAPAQDLSKKLNQSNGVIHPKEVDPAIEKGAPNVQDPNVVPSASDFGRVCRAAAEISAASWRLAEGAVGDN